MPFFFFFHRRGFPPQPLLVPTPLPAPALIPAHCPAPPEALFSLGPGSKPPPKTPRPEKVRASTDASPPRAGAGGSDRRRAEQDETGLRLSRFRGSWPRGVRLSNRPRMTGPLTQVGALGSAGDEVLPEMRAQAGSRGGVREWRGERSLQRRPEQKRGPS